MSKNINQVFTANPQTSNEDLDLMYFGRSPYGGTDDIAMTYSNFWRGIVLPALTTATGALNATYNNGTAGVGAYLEDASGTFAPFTNDGVAYSVGQDQTICVPFQADPKHNGYYYLAINGNSVDTPWRLVRHPLFDTIAQVNKRRPIVTYNGNSRASEINVVVGPDITAIGTDDINFLSSLQLALYNAAANTILGNSTGSAGAVQELIPGGGLTLSGGTALVTQNNIIIGGNFSTNPWQRGTSVTGSAANAYLADRFKRQSGNDAVVDIAKIADSPTPAEASVHSTHCWQLDVTTADGTIGAAQYEQLDYFVEGFDLLQSGFGQSGTRYVTLSFWHKHTKTGTYCVAFRNSAANRSYVIEYTQDSSDVWEFAEHTIPVDTSGTWLTTNGIGMRISFVSAMGTNFHGTADTWTAGNIISTSSQVNALDSNSNYVRFALVKLEPGQHATPYPFENEADILGRCQRYFYKSFNFTQAVVDNPGTNTGARFYVATVTGVFTNTMPVALPVRMRATPTTTFYNPQATGTNWYNASDAGNSGASSVGVSGDGFIGIQNAQVAGDGQGESLVIQMTCDAEL